MPLEEIDGTATARPHHRPPRGRPGGGRTGSGGPRARWIRQADRRRPARFERRPPTSSLPASPAARSTASTSPNRWSPASAPSIACCPCGNGQRMGIFGGSGVGKSTLLGAMSRHNSADVTVIALIGERNREVRGVSGTRARSARAAALGGGLLHLGPARSRCASAPASWRWRSPNTSATRAPDVLLVMDSVTRLAMAQREIGLAAGEPPSQKGYTPSVFQPAAQDP